MRRYLLAAGVALGLLASAAAAWSYKRDILRTWERWRYPPPKGPAISPLGEEILQGEEARKIEQIKRRYAEIRARLDSARTQGLKVDSLEPKLTLAMNLARRKRYREAMLVFNRIEMGIPRRRQQLVPAVPEDGVSEEPKFEGAPVKPAPRPRRKKPPAQ